MAPVFAYRHAKKYKFVIVSTNRRIKRQRRLISEDVLFKNQL